VIRSKKCRVFLLVGILLVAPFSAAKAAEFWSRFRGEDASGTAVQAGIPKSWGNNENVYWKVDLPGRGASSPVFRDSRIYLTSFTGYGLENGGPGTPADLKLHTLCIDFATGKIVWDQTIDASPNEQDATPRIVDHGYASPTPTVDDQAVYSSFGPSGLVAYDLEGKKLWQQSIGSRTEGFGSSSSPILYKDLVLINAAIEDHALYAFNKRTGEAVWRVDGIMKAWTTPTLVTLKDRSVEMILYQKDWIRGFNPDTGEELWRCRGIDDYVVPCVVADGELLYCSAGRQNKTIAVKAGGRGDVTDTHKLWTAILGANVTSPLFHDGYLYWSHDKSMALCVRASDGEEMYRKRLPTSARVYASVVLAGDRLIMTTRDAGILVLAAKPQYEELGLFKLGDEGEIFSATPAIVGDSILFRSDSRLYRIAEKP
jgi:outer membrane protein assembly factor BamB